MTDVKPRLLHKLGWFMALWLGGVLSLAAIGYGIRYWLGM